MSSLSWSKMDNIVLGSFFADANLFCSEVLSSLPNSVTVLSRFPPQGETICCSKKSPIGVPVVIWRGRGLSGGNSQLAGG